MLIPPARKGNTQCRIIQLDSFSWGNKIYWNISIRFLFLNYKAFDLYIYIYIYIYIYMPYTYDMSHIMISKKMYLKWWSVLYIQRSLLILAHQSSLIKVHLTIFKKKLLRIHRRFVFYKYPQPYPTKSSWERNLFSLHWLYMA